MTETFHFSCQELKSQETESLIKQLQTGEISGSKFIKGINELAKDDPELKKSLKGREIVIDGEKTYVLRIKGEEVGVEVRKTKLIYRDESGSSLFSLARKRLRNFLE